MNFSSNRYSQLKSRLKSKYKRILKRTLEDLRNYPDLSIAKWITAHSDEINIYSSLNWHFLNHIKNLIFFLKQDPFLGRFDFGTREEEVFERWNKSEFSDIFLKELNKGNYLGKASLTTCRYYDRFLITFAQRHILKENKNSKFYRVQTSLGEIQNEFRITKSLETTLHKDGKEITLLTANFKEMKKFSQRIETALIVIKELSPSSWERFSAFTENIVPIKQKEFVSYSHQDLPGFSMINLYHRDFVDLMDDLLHENGHHHLNYYLNISNLIIEPVDCIYYSPWRGTLRPFRGIFHAYFTFFWTFKLFSDLILAGRLKSSFYTFAQEEKEKIIWRCLEEYYMLNFTFNDLKWANKQALINRTGWSLIQEQQKELKKFQKHVPKLVKKLTTHKNDFKILMETLKKAEIEFKKS